MSNKKYGWRPDVPDFRDFVYGDGVGRGQIPLHVDLRPQMQPVYDQGALGSCTANAIAGAFEFDLLKQGLTDFMPSRLFIYYNERAMEGTVDQDAGAIIRDGVKTLKSKGVADEKEWPYDIDKFAEKPPASAYLDAKQSKALRYERVNNSQAYNIQHALANGFPVIFGMAVYESFEGEEPANSGMVPMPEPGEKQLGGHAMVIVGYDIPSGRFIVRNSWGAGWGDKGYCYIPFEYLTNTNLSDDHWVIQQVK